jgi:uncharacterized protein (TIGR03000 family)
MHMSRGTLTLIALPVTALAALLLGVGLSFAQRGGHGGSHGGNHGGVHAGAVHRAPASVSSVHRAPASVGSVHRTPVSVGGERATTSRSVNRATASIGAVSRPPASFNSASRGPTYTYPRATNSGFSHGSSGSVHNYSYGSRGSPGSYYSRHRLPTSAAFASAFYPGFYGLGLFPGYYDGFGNLASLATFGAGYPDDGGYGAGYFPPPADGFGAGAFGPGLAAVPGAGAPPAADMPPLTAEDVVLHVHVPPAATVWINGIKTATTGEFREFMSTGLAPGKSYTYIVRVKWSDGPLEFDQTRKIKVQGGEVRNVDFAAPPPE